MVSGLVFFCGVLCVCVVNDMIGSLDVDFEVDCKRGKNDYVEIRILLISCYMGLVIICGFGFGWGIIVDYVWYEFEYFRYGVLNDVL